MRAKAWAGIDFFSAKGILPDPEDATFMRPTIELKLPKHLALKAAKAAALVPMPPAGGSAGGKALRRTRM